MLKKISPLISPALLKTLAEMGHGDTLVLADANFPAKSSKAKKLLRADGIGIPALLQAILELFPVDSFVLKPIGLMQVVSGDDYVPNIWEQYKKILSANGIFEHSIEYFERFEYYKQTDRAYCVVATGERSRYANIIIKKGVLEEYEE